MIVKNTKTIDEVYRRDAKVSMSRMLFFWRSNFAIFQANNLIIPPSFPFVQQLGKGTYGEVTACTHIETG